MSATAKAARAALKSKANRLVRTDPKAQVDASGYTPPDALNADVQTGMKPISKRAFKRGGKVVHMHGKEAAKHAGRTQRKSGGSATMIDSMINRDVKVANDKRDGIHHVGGFKRGGKIHKLGGGTIGNNPVTQSMQGMGAAAMRKRGGKTMKREHHADGSSVGSDDAIANYLNSPEGQTGPMQPTPAPVRQKPTPEQSWADTRAAQADDARRAASAKAFGEEQKEYQRSLQHYKSGGKVGKWIKSAIKHPGALHKALHVPAGEKIPAKKLEKAAHSDNPKMAKRANFAKTLGRMHHAKGGATHPDEAEDKKLIKKMVKPSAIAHKAHGGEASHPKGCSCHKCSGGRIGRATGGNVPETTKISGTRPTGDRVAKASGGQLSPFGQAFRAARSAGQSTFNFNGKTYTTQMKGENAPMPPSRPSDLGSSGGQSQTAPVASSDGLQYKGMPLQPEFFQRNNYANLADAGNNAPPMSVSSAVDAARQKLGSALAQHESDVAADNQNADMGPVYGPAGLKRGGRAARKDGGRTSGKGKMNVNVIIAGHGQHPGMGQQGMMPPNGMPPKPQGMPVPVPSAGGMPMGGMPPGGAMPMMPMGMMPPSGPSGAPPQMPPMGRKSGGRANDVMFHMSAGARSGEGRLEKAKLHKRKR